MAESIIQRSPNVRQYVYEMRSAYHGIRLFNPDVALAQDPFVWEKMLRDPHVRKIAGDRCRAVAGRDWTMEPGSDSEESSAAAGLADAAFRKIKKFSAARYGLASGVFTGSAYRYAQYQRIDADLNGTGRRSWLIPLHLEPVDYRGIELVPEWVDDGDRKKIIVHTEVRDFTTGQFHRISPEHARCLIPVVWEDDESRLGYGRGLQESMYFFFYLKGKTLQEGMQWLERWAQGMVIGKVDATAPGRKDADADTVATTMMNKLEKMRGRGIFVMDTRDEVEALFASGQGSQAVEQFLQYFDSKLSQLVLGSMRPSGQDTDTGARAAAETEDEYAEGVYQFDRDLLAEAITEHLVLPWWRMNREAIAAVGLSGAEPPRFSLAQEQREDPKEAAEVAVTLLNSQIPLDADEVYRKTGWMKPRKNQAGEWEGEVLEGAPQPAQPAPGSSPFPFQDEPAAVFDDKWDESKHPRSDDGRFGPKAGERKKDPITSKYDRATIEKALKSLGGSPDASEATDKKSSRKKAKPKAAIEPPPKKESAVGTAKEWASSLSEDERQSVREYIGGGYEDIRQFALTGKGTSDYSEKELASMTAAMDAAISRGPTHEKPVYRGLSNVPREVAEQMVDSGSVEWPSFSSTSASKKQASGFARGDPDKGEVSVMFEIAGHEGVDISSLAGGVKAQEKEVLLPRGSKFKVAGHKVVKGNKYMGKADQFVIRLEAHNG